ncbi:hypothetical protein [Mesorhizobium sp.]|uniref:hypothetical protein n=1 Tax=Mesorhizobium sp. TaxID=1871066 RepID=UPI0025C6A27B|nr:hypothetical protein [Mesorhizobium sp.]
MSPADLEQTVFELEEVRIVVRAPVNARLGDYDYARKAAGTASVSEWLDQRVKPLLKGASVAVVSGDGSFRTGAPRCPPCGPATPPDPGHSTGGLSQSNGWPLGCMSPLRVLPLARTHDPAALLDGRLRHFAHEVAGGSRSIGWRLLPDVAQPFDMAAVRTQRLSGRLSRKITDNHGGHRCGYG